jgi:beta-lactam-binding protein with PASTA domain
VNSELKIKVLEENGITYTSHEEKDKNRDNGQIAGKAIA